MNRQSFILKFKLLLKRPNLGQYMPSSILKRLKEFINPVKDLIGFGKIGQFLNITQRDEGP